MLRALTIQDVVLIEAAELHFLPGLNVLTGETGAGKSILLDALGFVLGWRSRADILRAGAARAEVIAEFHLPPAHPAHALLEEAGLPVEDALILRRVASAEGRRQAYANDRRVTAETLRGLADTLVELHGQQDDRGLLDPRGHRRLLDAFAAVEPALRAVRTAWAERAEAERALAEARTDLEAAERDRDYLEHAVGELDVLDPQPEEEPQLADRRRQLQAAERIREDVASAAAALGPDGAEGPMLQALRWLEGAAGGAGDALDPVLDRLGGIVDALAQVSGEVETLLADLGGDPGELERIEERLFAIRGLARKHQVAPDALPELARGLRGRLHAMEDGAADLSRLEAARDATQARYAAAAADLSAARRAAAGELDARMARELSPLKLGRAVFSTEVSEAPPGPEGIDQVRFTAATNPGAAAGPIDRIASGGELSRFLLALKVCLSARNADLTLIFDEIDRGVGGSTADAVGRRLQALGEGAQVLVVTHSPQVAARGAHHWRVGKSVADDVTRTEVRPLAPSDRVEEVARMLAGDVITAEARAAARALLDA